MRKSMGFFAAAAFLSLLLTGCSSVKPADVSAGMNGLQQRVLTIRNIGGEFGASYDDVWYGVISTLQLNGFVLKQADKSAGFIYGVWENSYERQVETSAGGIILVQAVAPPGYTFGGFFSRTDVYKQVDVSVTLESLSKTETQVRLFARFDTDGVPVAEGVFANRFFGLLRKEIFLRKNSGSIYWTAAATSKSE